MVAIKFVEIDLLLVEQDATTDFQYVVDAFDLPFESAYVIDFIEQYLQVLL